MDADTPAGWSYNPSSWSQRLPIVALALAGACIAGYLALYQLGLVERVWEPFFGEGSRTILTSSVSRVLPIPDAALGAFGYLLDAVTGVIGGRARWRTLPWMVVVFGLAVGPLGAVSILLVILQPVLFDAWCTFCLASAVVSLAMIGPALDEILASLQHLARARAAGRSVWRAFWGLDSIRSEPAQTSTRGQRKQAENMWPRLASLALGIWLMAAPALLDYDDPARASDRIVGPIVASVAFVAVWEVARALRWVNAGFGFWLLLAPWVLDHGPAATANSLAVGMLLLALAAVRGSMRRRFGGGLQYPRPRPPRRPRSPARVPGSPRLRRPDRDERLPITVSLLLVVRTQSAGAMTAEVFDQFLRRRVKPTSRSTSVPQAA